MKANKINKNKKEAIAAKIYFGIKGLYPITLLFASITALITLSVKPSDGYRHRLHEKGYRYCFTGNLTDLPLQASITLYHILFSKTQATALHSPTPGPGYFLRKSR